MKLRALLKGAPQVLVKGSKEISITGITAHAQSLAPGNLFVAKKGLKTDGARFIPDAVRAGAAAVLTDIYDPFAKGITQIIHPHPAAIEPVLASRFYRAPSKELFLVGVTGTNGKTTTTFLFAHILEHLGVPMGLIGSIERRIKEKVFPSPINTPDGITTQRFLREMVDAGCRAAVMEVTSHGLAQKRVEMLAFSVAIFTNLTQDHLDYHGSMEAYKEAKLKLFGMLDPVSDCKSPRSDVPADFTARQGAEREGNLNESWRARAHCPATKDAAKMNADFCNQTRGGLAVINADDPVAGEMVEATKGAVLTYGIESGVLRAEGVRLSPQGIQCTLRLHEQKIPLICPLIGRFNVYNCLAAIGAALRFGASLEQCCEALLSVRPIPGRMERVQSRRGVHIFVDYSHTEDALKNALTTLQELKEGGRRILTVFGCGGDRDKDKRPKMGRVAESLSDRIVVTSDNPRSEDPQGIISEIVKGLSFPERARIEVQRKEGIAAALREAEAGDIVLIAGKGHETYQLIGPKTLPFDDRLIAAELEATLHPIGS